MYMFATFFTDDSEPNYDPVLIGVFDCINKAIAAGKSVTLAEDDSWTIRRYAINEVNGGVTVWDDYTDSHREELAHLYAEFHPNGFPNN